MKAWAIIALSSLLGSRALLAISAALWNGWRGRCRIRWCVRGGAVEVKGTLWLTCRKHARVATHDALRLRHTRERGGGWVTYE